MNIKKETIPTFEKPINGIGFPWSISRMNFGLVMFLFSFAAGLFCVCIFNMLTFISIPVPLILLFLLSGFSIGGIFAVKFSALNLDSFLRVMKIMFICMVISILAFFFAFRFIDLLFKDYFTKDYTFSIYKIFGAMVLSSFWFLPFFVTYGIGEIAGYHLATKIWKNGCVVSYSVYLLATALAYLFFRQTIDFLGPWRLMGISIGILSVPLLILKKGYGLAKFLKLTFLVAIFLLLFNPEIDRWFLKSCPNGFSSVMFHSRRIIYQGWSKHCQFTLSEDNDGNTRGFYNNVCYWSFRRGQTECSLLEKIPFELKGHKTKIAIVGSGGGTHVKLALQYDPREIIAIETIPIVIDKLKGEFSPYVENIYNRERVKTYKIDGRKFFEKSHEKYDLIFLAFTEIDPLGIRTLFEPSELLFTVESFKEMTNHLNEGGMIAIIKNIMVDNRGLLFNHYISALRKVGLKTCGYISSSIPVRSDVSDGKEALEVLTRRFAYGDGYLILGIKTNNVPRIDNKVEEKLFEKGFIRVDDVDPIKFPPIKDDNPFKITPLFIKVNRLFFPTMSVLILVIPFLLGIMLILLIRLKYYRQDSDIKKYILFLKISPLALLVGMNFIMLESSLIFILYRALEISLDAVFLGTIFFLLVTGLGGYLSPFINKIWIFIISTFAVFMLFFSNGLTFLSGLGFIASAFATGTFFPVILQNNRERIAGLYTMDTLGTVIGGLLAFVLPLFLGYNFYHKLTATIFFLCFLMFIIMEGELKKGEGFQR